MESKSINAFIRDNRIRLDSERVAENPYMDDSRNMDHYKTVLKMGRKRMTVYFSKGYGHNGKEPNAAEVLDCIASDSASIENANGFEDWASEFGYDTDSRKAEKTFKVCERQATKLQNFLGDDLYNELLWETERL